MRWEDVMGVGRRGVWAAVCAVLAAVGVGGMAVMVGLWWGGAGGVVAAALVAGGVGVAYERVRWELGVRRVMALAREAQDGEAAAEAVGRVGGRAGGVAGVVAELLLEVKRQRGEMARLEAEQRQKVRNRTDALEREIGSLRAKAERDGLTGLLNRRALDEVLPGIVEGTRAKAGGEMCILMMDVDYFKALNDTRGHAAGDEFLRSMSQLIKSSIRPGDLAFRQGGDEFVVIMPGTRRDEAEAVGARVRSLVDAFVKPMRCERPPRVSVGVAALSEAGERTAKGVMKAADGALYKAKGDRRGRAA